MYLYFITLACKNLSENEKKKERNKLFLVTYPLEFRSLNAYKNMQKRRSDCVMQGAYY